MNFDGMILPVILPDLLSYSVVDILYKQIKT